MTVPQNYVSQQRQIVKLQICRLPVGLLTREISATLWKNYLEHFWG